MYTYWDAVDRNIGIITREQQEILHNSTVAVAGCGGMGGHLVATMVRLGVGKVKVADSDLFEPSNLNRQMACFRQTVGQNKALCTAAELERISKWCELEVFPEGVTAQTVERFVDGADVIADEIEFYGVANRIRLHREARNRGVVVFNCNVVGHGTRIFKFTPDSMTMEEFLGYEDAPADVDTPVDEAMIAKLVKRLVPELPPYIRQEVIDQRVFGERRVPILGATPILSTGIIANHIVMHLTGMETPPFKPIPPMPAYGLFDAAMMESRIVEGKWW